MLKRSITFKDLEGNSRTEDFYFNLTTKELVEMELSGEGNSYMDQIQRIVASERGGDIISTFQDIVLKAYGERNPNGINFDKVDLVTGAPLHLKFQGHPAYSALWVELATDHESGAAFINGVMPDDVAEQMAALKAQGTDGDSSNPPVAPPSKEEMLAMSDEEFEAVAGSDPKQMSQEMLMVAFQRKNKA